MFATAQSCKYQSLSGENCSFKGDLLWKVSVKQSVWSSEGGEGGVTLTAARRKVVTGQEYNSLGTAEAGFQQKKLRNTENVFCVHSKNGSVGHWESSNNSPKGSLGTALGKKVAAYNCFPLLHVSQLAQLNAIIPRLEPNSCDSVICCSPHKGFLDSLLWPTNTDTNNRT